MIIAFRRSVEGVLLACSAMEQNPGSELIFAEDTMELEKKLKFSCKEDKIIRLGFEPRHNISKLVLRMFGTKMEKISRLDPGPLNYIDLVLRHKHANPAELVQVLVSCKGDTGLLYCPKTKLARKYYSYMRTVSRTFHRMCMFARPDIVNGVLVAKIEQEHDVADIFCRWLANKNPDIPVAVVCGEGAWIGNGELLGLENFTSIDPDYINDLIERPGDREIEDLWDIYYDSQMIESRRNRNLAKKVQPKAVSALSAMSRKDRYKVERGIANCTLERFI